LISTTIKRENKNNWNGAECMKKINVLEVCGRLGLGGTEKNMQIITKYLNKRVFNVSACVLVPGGEREGAFRKMGIRIFHIKSPEEFAKLIKNKNIYVVHFHASEKHYQTFIRAANEAGALTIILMDNSGRMFNPEISKLIDRHMISKMIAIRYKKLYKVLDKDFHKNCRVLYCLVDLDEIEHFHLSSNEILQEKKKLGIGPRDLVIGGIGRPDISKWGNFYDMMPYLIKKVPNVKYLVMGVPEAIKEEIRKRKLDGYFIFLKSDPSDEAVPRFFQLINIYALSSSSGGESFGLTIAEAMACKKPVVVNSTPLVDNAQVELVDNGKTGFVVYSPKAFAEAIAYLASNKAVATRMGLAGYAKVKREYEAKKTTKMLEKRILELLQAKGIGIPKKIFKRYKKIHYFPSSKDIDDFEFEYERRLRDCVGKPDRVKILVGKHVAFSSLMQKFIRSIRLVNSRNIIMKRAEKK